MLREIQVEVARLGRQVHGLEHATAFLVQDVEALHEPQVVAHFLVTAGSATVVEIAAKCRPANGREHDIVAADSQVMVRVSCAQLELGRRERDFLAHHGRVEAHDLLVIVDGAAFAPQQVAAGRLEEAHALVGEHA